MAFLILSIRMEKFLYLHQLFHCAYFAPFGMKKNCNLFENMVYSRYRTSVLFCLGMESPWMRLMSTLDFVDWLGF